MTTNTTALLQIHIGMTQLSLLVDYQIKHLQPTVIFVFCTVIVEGHRQLFAEMPDLSHGGTIGSQLFLNNILRSKGYTGQPKNINKLIKKD